MVVLMFKPQFAELVRSGRKLQTVRPVRKRPVKVGDQLSLRQWSGLPYRSRQLYIREATVINSFEVEFDVFDIRIAGVLPSEEKQNAFAIADGFSDADEMLDWFTTTHGLPFKGVCIQWQ